MKKIIFLLAAMLVFGACRKDPDLDFLIKGQVVDVVTRQPVQGVEVYAEWVYFPCLFCTVEYQVMDRFTSDANGNFELAFRLGSEADKNLIYLKLQNIPAGYQYGARVNGSDERCIADHSFFEFMGYEVEDGADYLIELMPPTFARIQKPEIPPGWEQDTISLSGDNLCFPGPCYSSYCSQGGFSVLFPLMDNSLWENLSKPGWLRLGNRVNLSYQVRHDTVKFYGSLNEDCVFGDTTTLELSFKK